MEFSRIGSKIVDQKDKTHYFMNDVDINGILDGGYLDFNSESVYSSDINSGTKLLAFVYPALYWLGMKGMIITDIATIECSDGRYTNKYSKDIIGR